MLETIGVGAVVALVAAPLVAIGTAAGAADDVEVLASDFETTVEPWQGRQADIALTTDDAHGGDSSLLVSGRTDTWQGVQTPITSVFAPGATYTLSAWVKLAPGEEATTIKATVEEEPQAWTQVTPDVAVTADEWVQIEGEYTRGAAVTAGNLYFEAATTASFLVDDVVVTGPEYDGTPPEGDGTPPEGDGTDLTFTFEDGTPEGWAPRATEDGPPTVEVVTSGGQDSDHALRVSERVHQGQGVQYDVAGVLNPGISYQLEAWAKFEGESSGGALTLSARTRAEGSEADNFSNLVQATGIGTDWTRITGSFSLPAYGSVAEIYFETPWDNGNPGDTSTFLVDNIRITSPTLTVEDLTPLKETVPFPMGVAIDDRETRGPQGELSARHFNQVTGENHMKPEAWYDGEWNFRTHPQASAIMDAAVANGWRVYGHVLVWHSQTPEWFFTTDEGEPLASDDAGRAEMRERLRTHVFNVAKALHDEYGDFGSAGNPLVAWDVVNEVVSDNTAADSNGLRTSEWYRILGEEFIDLAFLYADEAFNEVYAAPGSDRPVKLFINDYNTEQPDKQGRYFDLVQRLLARGVPVDGVGHQFHVSMTLPVENLRAAIERFEALDVLQAVTELDVATGTPVTESKLIDQGYYYRDAFELFREKADRLFSVTVWGLYDGRSWVNDNGAPLLFDDSLKGKPAYYGAAGLDLPSRIRAANVFRGEVPLDDDALYAVEWVQLPPNLLGENGESGAFQARWTEDTLTVLVEVAGDAPGIELQVGDDTYAFSRDGSGDVDGVAGDVEGGWAAVVHLPLSGVSEGDTVPFNLVVDGGAGWTDRGATGQLTLIEKLSYLEVPQATDGVPTVDGDVDDVWAGLPAVSTVKQVSGTDTAAAEVRTLWADDSLFVLMEVADADIDSAATQPWEQDSVEIYVDAGNSKNGSYLPTDMQLRIGADGAVSFGTGPAEQGDRVTSAVKLTETGYVVEVEIGLLGLGGAETVHGLDFQVNDASNGARIGTRNWADATSQGYQSTAHWGVGRFVEGDVEPSGPSVSLSSTSVRAGEDLEVALSGFEPGAEVELVLGSGVTSSGAVGGAGSAVAPEDVVLLDTVVVGDGGTALATVTVPADTAPGTYLLGAAVDGDVLADAVLTVLAAAAPGDGGSDGGAGAGSGSGSGSGTGNLAVTGTDLALAAVALLVIAAGVALVIARRRGMTLAGVRQSLLRR